MRMILEYYGIKKDEKELRILFRTTPMHGTYWKHIKEGVKNLGLDFTYSKNNSMDIVEKLIKNGIPVVVSINAKMIGASEDVNHTVVVIGIDDEYVIFHDPETAGELS